MKKILYLSCIILSAFLCFNHPAIAQSTTITPGNSQPALTATSTNNGIIVPRITLTATLTSASPVTNPAIGLLIYNSGNNQTKGFYFWTGTTWQFLATATPFSATGPINITSNNIRLNAGTEVGQLLTWNGNNWVNTNARTSQTLENRQPFLAVNFCIALTGIYPSRNGYQPFLGEVALFSFSFAPKGWALCNGQLLPINQNQALFSLLGTMYGGNGQTTFALPDLRGRAAQGMGQGPGIIHNYTQGELSGINSNIIDNKY